MRKLQNDITMLNNIQNYWEQYTHSGGNYTMLETGITSVLKDKLHETIQKRAKV